MQRFIAFVVVACVGCSFAGVSGPPSDPSERTQGAASRCTTSVLYPVLDSVSAGIGALNIGIAANASPGKVAWYGIEMDSETGVALGITQLALFGAGAVYGFVQTSRCNALQEELREKPDDASRSPERTSESNSQPSPEQATTTAPAPTPSASPAPAASNTSSAAAPATSKVPRPAAPAPTVPQVPTVSFPE